MPPPKNWASFSLSETTPAPPRHTHNSAFLENSEFRGHRNTKKKHSAPLSVWAAPPRSSTACLITSGAASRGGSPPVGQRKKKKKKTSKSQNSKVHTRNSKYRKFEPQKLEDIKKKSDARSMHESRKSTNDRKWPAVLRNSTTIREL